jgi:hypothetical protein
MDGPEDEKAAAGPPLVRMEDFAAVDWNGPAAASRQVEPEEIGKIYQVLLKTAEAAGDETARRVYLLLGQLCSITLNPKDRGAPFSARLRLSDGSRSAEPEDYLGPQNEVIAEVAAMASNPGLRARLGDIAWTNDRRRKESADLAVHAYCEAVEGLADGRFDGVFQERGASFEQVNYAMRALQIARSTNKGGALPELVTAAVKAVYNLARASGEHVIFTEIAGFAVAYGVVEATAAAADAEALASGEAPEGHRMAVQGTWIFAGETWRRAGDKESARRCFMKSVDMTLERARSGNSAFVASAFLQEAIEALRTIEDTHDLRAELKKELRERQQAAMDEMGGKPMRFDVTEVVEAYRSAYEKPDLPTALGAFSQIAAPEPKAKIEASALEGRKRTPLASLFAPRHHERDGKMIAKGPHQGVGEEVDGAWLASAVADACRMTRSHLAQAMIDPVRAQLHERFEITERHLWPIVALSGAAAADQKPILTLGFTRFFQGDFMSAAHLLLPQMEGIVRHILLTAGHDPTIIRADMTQEDATLSSILEGEMRQHLEVVMGEDLVLAIDLTFNRKPPGLRHVIAHGKLSAGECFSSQVIYACWFIFHIVTAPLWEHWEAEVARDIQAAADPGRPRNG